jgi:hypothetical protein
LENYFNYFTEIEECYRRCRNAPGLLTPLDWALIESWKEAGIPLEAVLIGIERAFQKFQKRPRRFQKVNSLAYCTQPVLAAAEELNAAASSGSSTAGTAAGKEAAPPFSPQEVADYLGRNAAMVEKAAHSAAETNQTALAEDLGRVAATLHAAALRQGASAESTLEELERELTTLEEMIHASLVRASDVALLVAARGEVERGLGPYRRNMSAVQIESLERQLLKKRLFEHYRIPRLSLFYL